MPIPEVKIVYSWIYDQQWEIVWKYYKDHGFEGWIFPEEYPTSESVKEYIEEVRPMWDLVEKPILEAMSKVTGIDWEIDKILAYVVGYHIPFSDPLTLRVCKIKEDFIDDLIHEVIHQLISQPSARKRLSSYWEELRAIYPDVEGKTLTHIPVHAIYEAVYREVFDEERLSKDIKRAQSDESYRKAWEIVQEKGYQQVIDKLKNPRV